jgi:hypothetical protein
MMRLAPLVALLALVAHSAAGAERFADPTRAFVEGYDPSGNDFFANVPERTVLLRSRADLDGDGHEDLALSDSSTWGNAGGQWLLFRGQADGTYAYWGTLFFAPGATGLRIVGPGEGQLTIYMRTGPTRGTLQTHRLTSAGLTQVTARALDLDVPYDRQLYEALLTAGAAPLPVEFCKLLDYRRDPATCWHPGLGLR